MSADAPSIQPVLHQVLNHLITNPYPHVPTPTGCKKRASVAVILRVRPAYKPIPLPSASVIDISPPISPPSDLDAFFSQSWVQAGDPEVLFIKRAGRASDRWSGHVALPGGKRDPEDASDSAAAIRETREEVGLDLTTNCLPAGNLPERVVATTWGREALMVLCPYIFIMTGRSVPPIQPQPTEVASAHWVPLRALLSPNLRTQEYVDTASRMAKQGGPIAQFLLRALVGRMVFSAVRLAPSESTYASSIPGFLPQTPHHESIFFNNPPEPLTHQTPLILWGLTLGVLADFLDMLPPHNAVQLWKYPTFSVPDLRFLVWTFTRTLRANNAGDLSAGTWPYGSRSGNDTAADATTQAAPVPLAHTEAEPSRMHGAHRNEVGIGGLGVGKDPKHAVGALLTGYYERVNVAIMAFVVYRTALGGTIGVWLYRLWKRRSGNL